MALPEPQTAHCTFVSIHTTHVSRLLFFPVVTYRVRSLPVTGLAMSYSECDTTCDTVPLRHAVAMERQQPSSASGHRDLYVLCHMYSSDL